VAKTDEKLKPMNTKKSAVLTFYNRALVVFFALNGLLWVIWGIICLFTPQAWSGEVIPGMAVFDLGEAVARTEVRAMYGGLQIAIGLLALVAIFRPEHRATTLLFYVLALSGLALSRLYGIMLEDSSELIAFGITVTSDNYNQVGLGMYEGPNFLFAWALFLTRPR
jgi:Domain of unknown function (DUF4345)